MQSKLGNNWIFRLEYFGGLLTNIFSGETYTFEVNDAMFFFFLSKGLEISEAQAAYYKITSNYYNGNILTTDFINEKIFDYFEDEVIDINELIHLYLHERSKVSDIKYLRAPLEVSIYPTSICQLSCSFCYYEEKKKLYKNDFEIGMLKRVLKDLKDFQVLYLSILGGEPTKYTHIVELLNFIRDIKFKTTITTNALNISDELFDAIVNNPYLRVSVSLQSINDNTNELLTGVKATPVIKNILRLINAGKEVSINTVCTIQSMDELFELVDFCEENGISNFALNAYQDSKSNKHFNHSFKEYREISEKICEYIEEKGYNVSFDMQGCLTYSAFPELDSPIESEYDKCIYGCEAAKSKLEILPNGDVYPCCAFSRDSIRNISNVYNMSIERIWHEDETMQKLRNFRTKDSSCLKCKFSDFCNGGCPAFNHSNNNSFDEKGDSRCQMKCS